MSTRHASSFRRRAAQARHARLLALSVAACLGMGVVQAVRANDAPPPPSLDLSLPRVAATTASGPLKPKADGRNGGRRYGSGYEARGLGGAHADAASAPVGATTNERTAPDRRTNAQGPGGGAQGSAQRGGGPGRGGRR